MFLVVKTFSNRMLSILFLKKSHSSGFSMVMFVPGWVEVHPSFQTFIPIPCSIDRWVNRYKNKYSSIFVSSFSLSVFVPFVCYICYLCIWLAKDAYHIFNNLLFNLYFPFVANIFPDLDENLPLGVVFCVDHESDIIFSIRDRDQGVPGPSKFHLNLPYSWS